MIEIIKLGKVNNKMCEFICSPTGRLNRIQLGSIAENNLHRITTGKAPMHIEFLVYYDKPLPRTQRYFYVGYERLLPLIGKNQEEIIKITEDKSEEVEGTSEEIREIIEESEKEEPEYTDEGETTKVGDSAKRGLLLLLIIPIAIILWLFGGKK